jgi:hypothetical protein
MTDYNKNRTYSFFKKYSSVIGVLFCIGGIFPILTYNYELNAPFIFTLKYVGTLAFIYILIRSVLNAKRTGILQGVAGFVEMAFIGGLLTLMSTGYVLSINSNIGVQEQICLSGKVLNKSKDKQSGLTTTFILHLEKNGEKTKLIVDKKQFEQYDVGNDYSKCWHKGLFGLLYE